jgi:Ras-related protein Rab-1A
VLAQDTAGQERFRTITSSYYRGAHAVLVVFDVTVEESFQNVRKWLAELDAVNNAHSAHAPGSRGNGSGGLGSGSSFARHTQVLLVANKTDLTRARVVESHRIAAFADELGLPFVESSAKSNVNVSEAFHTIAQSFVERRLEDERAGWVEVGGPGGKKDVQNKHLRVSGTSVDDEEGSSWRKCFGACAIM